MTLWATPLHSHYCTKIPVNDPVAVVSYCLIPPWASINLWTKFGSIKKFVSALLQPGIEKKLLIKHAQLISLLEKEINYHEFVCRSASTLWETSVMLSSNVWPTLKVSEKGQVTTTLCPQWTTTAPMPSEMLKHEALSSQLIQLVSWTRPLPSPALDILQSPVRGREGLATAYRMHTLARTGTYYLSNAIINPACDYWNLIGHIYIPTCDTETVPQWPDPSFPVLVIIIHPVLGREWSGPWDLFNMPNIIRLGTYCAKVSSTIQSTIN